MNENPKRILFFDGVCHLCNGAVDFALPHFQPGMIYFAPLQGKTAQHALGNQAQGLDSVIYYRDGVALKKSKAVAELLIDMKKPYSFLGIMLRALPRSICDFIYDLVAKYRYQIFGKSDVCRLPTPKERLYFLD